MRGETRSIEAEDQNCATVRLRSWRRLVSPARASVLGQCQATRLMFCQSTAGRSASKRLYLSHCHGLFLPLSNQVYVLRITAISQVRLLGNVPLSSDSNKTNLISTSLSGTCTRATRQPYVMAGSMTRLLGRGKYYHRTKYCRMGYYHTAGDSEWRYIDLRVGICTLRLSEYCIL